MTEVDDIVIVDARRGDRYKYLAVDILTRRIIDEFPFSGVSYSFVRNDSGDFSGSLSQYYSKIDKLVSQKTYLVVEKEGEPFWVGVLWGVGKSGKLLNFAAQGVWSMFGHRNVRESRDYVAMDRGLVVRDLVEYAQTGISGDLGVETSVAFREEWSASDGSPWPDAWTHPAAFGTIVQIGGVGQQTTQTGGFADIQSVVSGVTDGEVLFKFRWTAATGERYIRALARYSSISDYYSIVIDGTSISLRKRVAGVNSDINTSTQTHNLNTWYWVRFQWNGTSLRAKVWADSVQEPAAWNVSGTDATFTVAGSAGVSSVNGAAGGAQITEFDDFRLSDFSDVLVGGTALSHSINWWDNKNVKEQVETIAKMDPSFTFSIKGSWEPGNLLALHFVIEPTYPVPTPHLLHYGANVDDYEWAPLSPSPNFVDAFGGFDGPAMIRRTAQNDDVLATQPRVERTVENRDMLVEDAVLNLAKNAVKKISGNPVQPSVTMTAAKSPELGQLMPGDQATVAIDDGPLIQVDAPHIVRVVTVTVPDGASGVPGTETVQLEFESAADDSAIGVT